MNYYKFIDIYCYEFYIIFFCLLKNLKKIFNVCKKYYSKGTMLSSMEEFVCLNIFTSLVIFLKPLKLRKLFDTHFYVVGLNALIDLNIKYYYPNLKLRQFYILSSFIFKTKIYYYLKYFSFKINFILYYFNHLYFQIKLKKAQTSQHTTLVVHKCIMLFF